MEQAAFGTGVLVDGLDFSDDKMLQGRTLSYSRYAALPRWPQLSAAADQPPEGAGRHQPARRADDVLRRSGPPNPHVNYEPSSMGGLKEATPAGKPHEPMVSGKLTRAKIERTNDFKQAGERFRAFEPWEREELIKNHVGEPERVQTGYSRPDDRLLHPG